MSNEYRIETVQDFIKIPFDKIDICIEEFKEGLKYAKELETRTKELTEILGGAFKSDGVEFKGFTWIDDGKTDKTYNTTVTMKTKNGE